MKYIYLVFEEGGKNDIQLLKRQEERLNITAPNKQVVTDAPNSIKASPNFENEVYVKVDELNSLLQNFIEDLLNKDSINFDVVDNLCNVYGVSVVYSLLPKRKQEMIVEYSEFMKDFGNDVPNNLLRLSEFKYEERTNSSVTLSAKPNCIKTKLENLKKDKVNKQIINDNFDEIIKDFIKE